MRTITMQEIKAQYPSPVAMPRRKATVLREQAEGAYCVGGAVCYAAQLSVETCPERPGFPTQVDIATALQSLNPSLRGEDANIYAYCIILSNDHWRMGIAWKMVEEALTRGRIRGATPPSP